MSKRKREISFHGDPQAESMWQGFEELAESLEQADFIGDSILAWYGVKRISELPSEGLARYDAEMETAGWGPPIGRNNV